MNLGIITVVVSLFWVLCKTDVFEASASDDVDYFLDNDPSKFRGILFYDPRQDDSSTKERIGTAAIAF